MTPEGNPAIRARGIVKRFPGVVALDHVDLDVHRGEVHTILGENGAGKTTIAAVCCGLYRPDEGELSIGGEPAELRGPRDGLARGVGMVHQHFRLVERFTVAENVMLGDPRLPRLLERRQIEKEVAVVAERFGLPVDPRATIADLSVGERQRVEIVKVLYRGADVLLLDEPTAVLTPQEVDALFGTVRSMVAAGKSVVFISHKLGEVMAISDRVTVMRAGRVTGEVTAATTDRHELARLMVGRDVDLSPRVAGADPGAVLLHVRGVSLADRDRKLLFDINLAVRAGEVLGVAGVSGNGQRELGEVIAGVQSPSAGTIEVAGVDVTGRGPRRAREAGLAFVPEERVGTGLAPSLTIAENVMLTRRRRFLVSRRAAAAEARDIIERYDVKASGPHATAGVLSGGNAQKVLLGRELADEATKVLVIASPTRGLDVGAIESVRAVIDGFRRRGAAVVLLSEDLDEVLSLADRLVVLYGGAIAYEGNAAGVSIERVGQAMAGVA